LFCDDGWVLHTVAASFQLLQSMVSSALNGKTPPLAVTAVLSYVVVLQ
jgi:hypothetical protein